MATATPPYTYQLRRDSELRWAEKNPVLALAEPGYELPNSDHEHGRMKIGDGITPWSRLPYFVPQATDDDDVVVVPGGDVVYVHTQSVSSDLWTVTHNLGKNPAVVVLDSALTHVETEIEYFDLNNLSIMFSGPTSGTATLN